MVVHVSKRDMIYALFFVNLVIICVLCMSQNDFANSELLCFLQQKSKILRTDDLMTHTADYCSSAEVKTAVALLYQYVDQRHVAFK